MKKTQFYIVLILQIIYAKSNSYMINFLKIYYLTMPSFQKNHTPKSHN